MGERLAADVAIVGGGTVGCSTALHLRRRGGSVVLIERGMCGGQASGVTCGGVRQQGRALAELPLARRSREIWTRLAALVGRDCEFAATGHIKLARSAADMAELETYREAVRPTGSRSRSSAATRSDRAIFGSAIRRSAARSAPRTARPIRGWWHLPSPAPRGPPGRYSRECGGHRDRA
jgi:glycine/D-amino acid oxidase-like deaminating enzyme